MSKLQIIAFALLSGGALTTLPGCEAPLELGAVEAVGALPIVRTDAFQDAVAFNGRTVFVGNRGVVVEKDGEGAEISRTVLAGETTPDFIEVDVCPDGRMFAVGIRGALWRRGRGDHWEELPDITEENVQDMTCDASSHLWVVGTFGTILKSVDAGETWDDRSVYDDVIFTSIDFPSRNAGVIVGEFSSVYVTKDAGETWENLESGPSEFYPLTGYFHTPRRGWIAGLSGEIFRTDDGGASWRREATPTTAPIYRIEDVGSRIMAVGNYGTVLERRDGEWRALSLDARTFGYLRAIAPTGAGVEAAGQSLIASVSRGHNSEGVGQ